MAPTVASMTKRPKDAGCRSSTCWGPKEKLRALGVKGRLDALGTSVKFKAKLNGLGLDARSFGERRDGESNEFRRCVRFDDSCVRFDDCTSDDGAGSAFSRLAPASATAPSTSSDSDTGAAVGHVFIIGGASVQRAMVMAPKPGLVTVLKLGPGMALKSGMAGCRGLARTSPRQVPRHAAPQTQPVVGRPSMRGRKRRSRDMQKKRSG